VYLGRSGLGFTFEIILGVGLVWNCLAGLLKREWMYDAQSTEMMFWSQLAGILIGAALICHALWLIRLLFQL
jgi:hypothetical protein